MREKIPGGTARGFVLRLYAYAKALTCLMFFLVLGNTVLMYVVPVFTEQVVDGLLASGQPAASLRLVLGYAAVLLASVLAANLERYVAIRHSEVVADRFRNDLFHILLRKSYVSFRQNAYGDVETAMTSCVEDVNDATYCFVETLLVYPIGILLGVAYISRITPWLLLVLLAQLALNFLIMRHGSLLRNRVQKENYRAQSSYFSALAALHHAYENIRLLCLLPRADEKHERESGGFARSNIKMARVNSIHISMLLELSDALLNIAVLCLFYGLIQRGQSSVGAYLAFMAMKEAISGSFNGFIKLKANKATFDAALVQIDAVEPLDEFLRYDFTPEQAEPVRAERLALSQVAYAYPGGDRRFLFDGEFQRGSCYVITGENGAGKTTLVRLLANMLAEESRVETGGAVVKALPQSIQLFDDSLVDMWLDKDSAFSEETAARLGVLDLVRRLRDGEVAAAGALSGGEKKKVLLSLLLGQPPDILLLDEPFAEIDAASKEALAEAVLDSVEGRIVILISHELPAPLRGRATVLRLESKDGLSRLCAAGAEEARAVSADGGGGGVALYL